MSFSLGSEGHTFTIVGRCARTGMIGIGITTSDIAVGSRCPFVKPSVGAVSTQANTDPRLGPFALRLLELGYSPQRAIHELEASDAHVERRQIGLVDAEGTSAARTGSLNTGWAGHIVKPNYVAMGNGLVGEQVVQAIADAFEGSEEQDLEERLLRGVEAGQAAGGETSFATATYHSAALLVHGSRSFSRVDLRVDEHATPLAELRRLLEIYREKIEFYTLRSADPEAALASREPS